MSPGDIYTYYSLTYDDSMNDKLALVVEMPKENPNVVEVLIDGEIMWVNKVFLRPVLEKCKIPERMVR